MLAIFFFLFSAVFAVPTVTYTRPTPSTVHVIYTRTPAGSGTAPSTVAFGFPQLTNPLLIMSGVVCQYGTPSTCFAVSCSGAVGTCVTPAVSLFTVGGAGEIITIDFTATADLFMSAPTFTLLWYERVAALSPDSVASFITAAPTFAALTLNPLYTSAAPTWGLTFTRPSATGVASTMIPAAGQTVLLGWKSSNLTANPPTEGVICALAATGTCVEFTCTIAATVPTCIAPSTSNFLANAVTTASAIVTVNTAGAVPIGASMFLAHSTATTPSSTPTSAYAQSQTYIDYSLATPVWASPTFALVFARTSDTTLNVSVIPPAGRTLFFGWRADEPTTWPADSVICAPGSVATCLDVSCTAAATCITRVATIYTTNAVTATSISLSRLLAVGAVPLVAGKKMWLATDSAATPTGTTTLSATSSQSRTWTLTSADLPAVTNDAKTFVPSLLVAICAILYVL